VVRRPARHVVAPDAGAGSPRPGGNAHLELERVEERARVGEVLPHAGQVRRATVAALEDDAVDVTPQRPHGLRARGHLERLGLAEQRDLDARDVELVAAERLEPIVVERRRDRVVLDVLAQRPSRRQAPDAAAELAVLLERHERRAGDVEPGRRRTVLGRVAPVGPQRPSGDGEERPARPVGQAGNRIRSSSVDGRHPWKVGSGQPG